MFAAWGALEWALASIAGIDIMHTLTAWLHPQGDKNSDSKWMDWKLWASLAGLVLLCIMVWREIQPRGYRRGF